MNLLLHNRRKYVGERALPSGSGVWADFDLDKSTFTTYAQLRDPGSASCAGDPLQVYTIGAGPGDSLLLAADNQTHGYVWGFASGHEFDLSQVNQIYTSRTLSVNNQGWHFSPDGTAVARCYGTTAYRYSLGIPYNLGTTSNSAQFISAAGDGAAENMTASAISRDGTRVIYKNSTSSLLYQLTLDRSVWEGTYPRLVTLEKLFLSDFDAAVNGGGSAMGWRGFTMSPDGKALVMTSNTYVVKFVLSTPWDVTTAAYHSKKILTSYVRSADSSAAVTLYGVAVNSTGTKMIVHNRANDTRARARFFGFDLAV